MTDPRSPLPELLAATGFAYAQCDAPAGVTLDEWRRTRHCAWRAAQIAARRERRRALVAIVRRRTTLACVQALWGKHGPPDRGGGDGLHGTDRTATTREQARDSSG